MALDPATPINRRTVTKGIAWSVPAVAIAGAAPAFALSGLPPTITFRSACKWPGDACHLDLEKSYGVSFDVTNNGAEAIYLCPVSLVVTSGDTFQDADVVWTPKGPTSGCYTVAPGATETVVFRFENSTKSENLTFNADVTISWSHNCNGNNDCSGDPQGHPNITRSIVVGSTPPGGDCTCGALKA